MIRKRINIRELQTSDKLLKRMPLLTTSNLSHYLGKKKKKTMHNFMIIYTLILMYWIFNVCVRV